MYIPFGIGAASFRDPFLVPSRESLSCRLARLR